VALSATLVCLHGFMDTARTWDLVRPALERRHDVVALTLPGHAGGAPLPDELSDATMADAVEAAMVDAGIEEATLVGNSLGGFLALRLAAAILATPEGRRRATRYITERCEHIPAELTPLASDVRCGSCGAPRTGSFPGRPPPPASATSGCRTPTGSSSTASATARSSTCPSRRRR
jgi:pimeloyl-ACP methyl ester carboxylesterase